GHAGEVQDAGFPRQRPAEAQAVIRAGFGALGHTGIGCAEWAGSVKAFNAVHGDRADVLRVHARFRIIGLVGTGVLVVHRYRELSALWSWVFQAVENLRWASCSVARSKQSSSMETPCIRRRTSTKWLRKSRWMMPIASPGSVKSGVCWRQPENVSH